MRIEGYCIRAWTWSYRLIWHLPQVFSSSRVMAGHPDSLSDNLSSWQETRLHSTARPCRRAQGQMKHSDPSLWLANWANRGVKANSRHAFKYQDATSQNQTISMNSLQCSKKIYFWLTGKKRVKCFLGKLWQGRGNLRKPIYCELLWV